MRTITAYLPRHQERRAYWKAVFEDSPPILDIDEGKYSFLMETQNQYTELCREDMLH